MRELQSVIVFINEVRSVVEPHFGPVYVDMREEENIYFNFRIRLHDTWIGYVHILSNEEISHGSYSGIRSSGNHIGHILATKCREQLTPVLKEINNG